MNISKVIGIALITFKGGIRDRVFITIILVSLVCFFFVVPTISSMSMRQVKEVSVGLSLSIISFVCLVLTLFLGVNLIYRDLDRRFAHTILSLPIRREVYILGKFFGLCSIIGIGFLILPLSATFGIILSSQIARTGTILWENFIAALYLDFIGLVIIAAITAFFSSFSTNVFLPLFGAIGFYIGGNSIQTVSEFIKTSYGEKLPLFSVLLSKFAYYILPNLTVFDIKFNAIYGIPLSATYLLTVTAYGITYIAITLTLTVFIFKKREIT